MAFSIFHFPSSRNFIASFSEAPVLRQNYITLALFFSLVVPNYHYG